LNKQQLNFVVCGKLVFMASLFLMLIHPGVARSQDGPGLINDPLKLLESLEGRRKALDKRASQLEIREQDLLRLEDKLAKRIASLEKLRKVIQRDLTKEKEINTKNIARLAKIYGSMKVKSAALGLQSIDQDIAVKVLKVMSEKTAGKILGKMKGGNAVVLANELGISIGERRSRNR
jgi:flagellar motility protein MotE (MotC chaperone)